VDIGRLSPDDLDEVRPAWLALCEHLDTLETRMGPLRAPDELWRRRRERYAKWLEEYPAACVLVAREDGRLLGYAMVQLKPGWDVRITGDPVAELQTLSVMPEGRGRGVGAALSRAVDEHLRDHGVREITVGVSTANEGALRFYAREGYRPLMSTWWARPVPEAASADVPVEVVEPHRVDELRPLWRALCAHHDAVGPDYLPERRDPDEAFSMQRDRMTADEAFLMRAPGGYVYGYVGGGFDVWDTGRVGAVEALVVDDGGRGKGTGAALLNAAFEVLHARRANAVELDVLEGNTRAMGFYSRMGLQREFEALFKRV
jgi:ribosomal protein S18 acetylase RimI-like enzyme